MMWEEVADAIAALAAFGLPPVVLAYLIWAFSTDVRREREEDEERLTAHWRCMEERERGRERIRRD